ncbi:MAG: hypothetical protein ACLUG4_10220 [Bacilli bacterium]|mgnify:FL=1|jgi:hypothetical protein
MINSSKLELIIFEIWNLKGGVMMPVLDLSNKETQTLKGILLVEKSDLEELISNEDNAKDKKGLEGELERVNSMLQKLQ